MENLIPRVHGFMTDSVNVAALHTYVCLHASLPVHARAHDTCVCGRLYVSTDTRSRRERGRERGRARARVRVRVLVCVRRGAATLVRGGLPGSDESLPDGATIAVRVDLDARPRGEFCRSALRHLSFRQLSFAPAFFAPFLVYVTLVRATLVRATFSRFIFIRATFR
eukprot:6189331-Pleurochrysis_carterae.AAC.1